MRVPSRAVRPYRPQISKRSKMSKQLRQRQKLPGLMVPSLVTDMLRHSKEEKRISNRRPGRKARPGPRAIPKSLSALTPQTLATAPVAVGQVTRGASWEFGRAPPHKGGGRAGIRLSGRQIWFQIGADSGPHSGNPIYSYGGSNLSALTFDPDDVKTMPPPMTSLSQVFQRYCLRKAKIVYTPGAAATSTALSFALMASSDAGYVQNALAGQTTGWGETVLENSNSVQGPIWQRMELDVPLDDELRYTYQSSSDGSLTDAENRQDHAFGVAGSFCQGTPTESLNYGFVHLEYTIDFYEIVAQTNEGSLRRLRQCLAFREEMKVLREAKVLAEEKKLLAPVTLSLQEHEPVREELKGHVTVRSTATSSEVRPHASAEDQVTPGLSAGWTRVPSRK